MNDLSRNSRAVLSIDPATAFNFLPEAYLILDERFHIVLANARYLALFGLALADVEGQSIYDINQFGSQEQRDARRAWLDTTLTRLGRGETRTSPLIRYDVALPGATDDTLSTRYWQIKVGVLAPSGPGSALIAVCVTDVTDSIVATERSQRERAKLRSQARLRQVLVDEANVQLRDHREQFQQALEFAHVGAWELNRESGLFACTDQCKADFGLPIQATLTEERLFSELIDVADRTRVRDALDRAFERRERFEVDCRVVWPDQSQRWILLRGMGRYEADTARQSMAGFTLDITTRKEAELEQMAIAEEEKRAREQSDQTARSMDHFVTAVSHELRSPLSAILSWTVLLQRAADVSHARRASDVIERNARQLSHMVDDLLDSGAMVTGKLSVDMRPVDLAALAGNVAEDIRINAESKGLRLVADDLASCVVLADESRMKQIVWNLLSNAVKFSVAGTVELTVVKRRDTAELTVRDSGCGIEPEALEKVFERFEQVSTTGGGRIAGLGLGLWLVKNLVSLHRGRVTAESAGPGQGATFRVVLPLYR